MFEAYSHVEVASAKKICDDVIFIERIPNVTLVALADGATGFGDGRTAASLFVVAATLAKPITHDDMLQAGCLAELAISRCGLECDTTGIIISIKPDGTMLGVSAGDSEVWLIRPDAHEPEVLTGGQVRKPRFGSGAQPKLFTGTLTNQRMLVASDGVFDMLRSRDIVDIVANGPVRDVPRALRDKIFGRWKCLPDDFSAIVVAST